MNEPLTETQVQLVNTLNSLTRAIDATECPVLRKNLFVAWNGLWLDLVDNTGLHEFRAMDLVIAPEE